MWIPTCPGVCGSGCHKSGDVQTRLPTIPALLGRGNGPCGAGIGMRLLVATALGALEICLLDGVDDELSVLVAGDGDGQRPGAGVGGVVGVDPGTAVADLDRPVASGLGGVELGGDLASHPVASAA